MPFIVAAVVTVSQYSVCYLAVPPLGLRFRNDLNQRR